MSELWRPSDYDVDADPDPYVVRIRWHQRITYVKLVDGLREIDRRIAQLTREKTSPHTWSPYV